ncbi:MAG: DUF2806 domain-containing protein [Rhodopila sp.]|jgi:hypothetical protein
MDEPNGDMSLINLGQLTKPATTLIEKVSDAIGGIAKPWQITRVASAEAKAELIRLESKIKLSDIERRALQRMVREEGKKQKNIESITNNAITSLLPDSKPEEIKEDWLLHFFDQGKLISNLDLQLLWGSLLAGEANKPGSISKKTVSLVAAMDAEDARLFVRFCKFVWKKDETRVLVLPDLESEMFQEAQIGILGIDHMVDLGMLRYRNQFVSFAARERWEASYFDQRVVINFNSEGRSLYIGPHIFTRAGEELAGICIGEPSQEYFQWITRLWSGDDGVLHLSSPDTPEDAHLGEHFQRSGVIGPKS